MSKFFVRPDGSYVGAFDVPDDDLAGLLPPGAVEVETPPADGRQVWGFPGWSPAPAPGPAPLDIEGLADLLVAKAVLTRAEIDGKRK